MEAPNSNRRVGENIKLSIAEIEQYADLGYLVIPNVLFEDEMKEIEPWFDHFVAGNESEKMGRDFCDMSQSYDTPVEDFQLVNAMLPSLYRKEFANNLFHRVSQNIASQLYTDGIAAMDYEQFLAKKPSKPGAEFSMHQDLGYWPKTKNTWTATFSLAINDSDKTNGCLQVIPGTNKESELRRHFPISSNDMEMDREDSHALTIESLPTDEVVFLPVKRGSITIHDERIVHGSGGNFSSDWRKTYVVAYRDQRTIEEERAIGFTHSHNDSLDWKEVL